MMTSSRKGIFVVQDRGIPFLTRIQCNDRGILNTAHMGMGQNLGPRGRQFGMANFTVKTF